ncbi:MAG: LysM peptidoglycan-binding domain-containing protein [Deltaproteobacteria bacterium]|nr:LysM peptidoglycan-binding domain-containing protein [Deltaproteobacteria bacterium]
MRKMRRLSWICSGLLMVFLLQAIAEELKEVYRVEKGDTLWGISGRFYGDPYRWLDLWHNNPHMANPDLIYPGDCLVIRGAEIPGNVYVVQKGDTLGSIAAQVYGDVSRWRELWEKNKGGRNLLKNPNLIYPWDRLVVRDIEGEPKAVLPPECGEVLEGEVQTSFLGDVVKLKIPVSNRGWSLRNGSLAIGLGQSENDIDLDGDSVGIASTSAGYVSYYVEAEYFFYKPWAVEVTANRGYPNYDLDLGAAGVTTLDATATEFQAFLKYQFTIEREGRVMTLSPKVGFEWLDFDIDGSAVVFVPDYRFMGASVGGEVDIPFTNRVSMFTSLLYFPYFHYREDPEISGDDLRKGFSGQFDLGFRWWLLDQLVVEAMIDHTQFGQGFSNGTRGVTAYSTLEQDLLYRSGRLGLRWVF